MWYLVVSIPDLCTLTYFQYDLHCAKYYDISHSNLVRHHCGLLYGLIPLRTRSDLLTGSSIFVLSPRCCLYCSDQLSLNQVLVTVDAAIYDAMLCTHSGHTGDVLDIFTGNSGNKVDNN